MTDFTTLSDVDLFDELFPDPPAWTRAFRPHQAAAIRDIIEQIETGATTIFLDAPTGAGKTLIAEAVRRYLNIQTIYICSTKSLQGQFAADFPNAAVLKGRANYQSQTRGYDCSNCDLQTVEGEGRLCSFCPDHHTCEYLTARDRAQSSELAVLNTAYFLAAQNHVHLFPRHRFVIVDEGDLIPDDICNFAGVTISTRLQLDAGVTPPKNVSDIDVLNEQLPSWAEKTAQQILNYARTLNDKKDREAARSTADRVADIGHNEHDATWIVTGVNRRKNKSKKFTYPFEIKAVHSPPVATYLTSHTDYTLVMSATLVSAQLMADALNIPDEEWAVVKMDSPFAPERRAVIGSRSTPVLSRKSMADGIPQPAVDMYKDIVAAHPDDRILVHAPSYSLCQSVAAIPTSRSVFSYTSAADRDRTLKVWLDSPNGILLSPSFARGLDLKHDLCRTQIIFKLPIPNIGDPQVKARLYSAGGQDWMALTTIREFIQSVGRVCRSTDDWGNTYVVDGKLWEILASHPLFFPDWFRQSIISNKPSNKSSELQLAHLAATGRNLHIPNTGGGGKGPTSRQSDHCGTTPTQTRRKRMTRAEAQASFRSSNNNKKAK